MSISQRRAIFYVKPGYWILCDLLRGQDRKQHTLEQIFHLAPIFAPGTACRCAPARSSVARRRPS